MNFVFVYGTLLSGLSNNHIIAPFVESVSTGTIQGKLCHMPEKGYPMLFPADSLVRGEVVEIKNVSQALATLDCLEQYLGPEHPDNEYDRQSIDVLTDSGASIKAWVYICPKDLQEKIWSSGIPIVNGNWRQFISTDSPQQL